MPTRRTRDKVWIAALTKTAMAGKAVTAEEIVEEVDASDRTVRGVLSVMADTPFLERDVQDGRGRFLPGPGLD